ncbi:MAG TPA: hypothetical protein DEE98_05540 [Elusimicrobia bacterium]|nr:MAG: hypothetical protein A2278_01635 [Elusimicrobia bacterium RIFOXYA12_FULL_49_49]OGS11645.1 MAG: hypothetical protein A2386_03180 [Elusimicrobia bacterium RIFOXYB1_FULL_48_9]OGS16750.1 MAG: hypothetical protein A2251_05085 [Elusimicrobia bacterium RIFOXYA2_FULL_47_53]OGS27031.1 MAG: hypothetical protein A2339_04940 [Elusimicrobia bacterium RIFOXYB12_FULL_50_12]OGS31978.1 MAG: hypothetical protein A2323_07860 [Elusimicrobia bacterium RIFOXYB2_FULL_46_23]HBU69830.1 hypothetical protein [El
MRRKVLVVFFPLIALLFAGCGKTNIFSWAHQSGGDTSTTALQSDALTALQDKDYAKALDYFLKILEQDPNNSEAIYGYSAAKLADAGLDLGDLIASLIKQQSSAPARLAPALESAASASLASNLLPSTIIANLTKIKIAIDAVIPRLSRISRGSADGKINADNPDVNLNLAFCYVLRAAIKVQESGAISFDTDYKVTVNTADTALANDVAKDIAIAYHRMLLVAENLNLTSGSAISGIKSDVNSLFDDLKSKISGITVDINHDYLLD